ncbi:arylalkylamine N-acetyltransferase-like 2 [Stomoxys calcitrans]|uniref:arylalkylamine N-acetyltransferase-like 2 n=1 Tax=Stomoxys calcitrans TaxID=35570 RepID=UPI0027E2FD1D|nr:arylalkylamine N-acetyltransferase-like 2 [Stomoxys calcitrans]
MIELKVVTKQDRPQVAKLLRKYFYPDEPLTGNLEPIGTASPADEEFILDNIQHGTCVMAIDRTTNKAVGVCIAGPQRANEADHLAHEAKKEGNTKWGKILSLLARIEYEAKVAERYSVQRILYIVGTCVDSSMRGRDLGGRLYNAVRDIGKAKGYQLLRSDCSSFYSAKIKEKLGWDCINTVHYKEFVDEHNVPVFSPPAPHVSCKSYALRL